MESVAQRISPVILDFLAKRLAEKGQDPSGLFGYYRDFLDRQTAFAAYDVPIAEFIARNARDYARYVEIGAGVGQLAVLLAADGFEAVAVEGDRRRFEAARDLFEAVASRMEGTGPRLRALHAFFPSPKVDMIDNDTLVIFTNIVHGSCDEEAMLSACSAAGGIIMDLVRFTKMRGSAESWSELVERVRSFGFAPPVTVYSRGEPSESNLRAWRLVYFHKR